MARKVTNVKDYEVWQSAIRGLIVLKRFDRKGDLINEKVAAGGKVMLLPEERLFNQELAASQEQDMFSNGMLIPLKLVESAEDYEELKGNPNHLTEDDMRVLLSKKADELRAGISEVTNAVTLQRMLAIAEADDDTTIKTVEVIKNRITEVTTGAAVYQEVETVATSDGRQVVQTSAPTSKAPRNPTMGRR